jgi:hypothetical protein
MQSIAVVAIGLRAEVTAQVTATSGVSVELILHAAQHLGEGVTFDRRVARSLREFV